MKLMCSSISFRNAITLNTRQGKTIENFEKVSRLIFKSSTIIRFQIVIRHTDFFTGYVDPDCCFLCKNTNFILYDPANY